MKRIFWVLFGGFAQLLFLVTVCRLFPFLQGGRFRGLLAPASPSTRSWFWSDGLLAVQFAVFHSAVLLPRVRKSLGGWIPSPVYGCFFCVVTCATLLLVMETWRPSRGAVWILQGKAGQAVSVAFLLSWAALFYSLALTGLGYQTGLAPWWAWARGREVPKRTFEPRGAYRLLRHPVYLSFLGLIWFNPEMTFDRATLALTWTVYIFIGSYLKDQRLSYYVGDAYRRYQTRVPGYPFVPLGPLGKLTPAESRSESFMMRNS